MEDNAHHLRRFSWLRYLLWLLIPPLLWWALRNTRFQDILTTLARLTWWQVLILLATNAGLIVLFGARWWILVRGYRESITIPLIAGYWLAGFGIDYFTPGPGVGGEPLQVALFHDRQGMRFPLATAAVGIDRLVDSTVNFAVLTFSAALVVHWHILHIHSSDAIATIALPAVLLLMLAAVIVAFIRGGLPVRWLAQRLPDRFKHTQPVIFLRRSELRVARLFRDHPRRLPGAIAISLIAWGGIFAEFWLLVSFLGLRLTIPQLVTAVTAHRMALLLPLPGGLGALEASQTLVFRALDLDPAIALSVALLIRARDVLVAGIGLIWGSWLVGGWGRLRQQLSANGQQGKDQS